MYDITPRIQRLIVETIHHERGPAPLMPLRRAAIISVIRNPFAGRYVEDIAGFMEELKPLGHAMAEQLVDVLGGDKSAVEGYGKGAIVGSDGELEHGALWHVPGGYAMREVLGEARAIVPSSKKIASMGASIDIPITHINASYVRSHFDAMELTQPGAPRADELLLALVMTTGPRIHSRVGGLRADQIEGQDGLR